MNDFIFIRYHRLKDRRVEKKGREKTLIEIVLNQKVIIQLIERVHHTCIYRDTRDLSRKPIL